MNIRGFCAEDVVDENCRYVVLSDGGWDWPLWKWKGEIITEGGHVYGKFFGGKAGFISGSIGVTHVAATAHRKSPLSALWTSYIRFAPRPQRANLPKF
ncbi:MAG: hypothetical protein K5890_12500 [Bacteroidales bacterium]|nr:hypothetical protein [Bacteroidales bacterium]